MEIKSLTSLRGVAAILVVVIHLRYRFADSFGLEIGTSFLDKSYLWVDFFFLLSGFILALTYGIQFRGKYHNRTFGNFLIRRFARVYPLHLLMLFAAVGLEAAKYVVPTYQSPPFSHYSPESLASHIFLVHAWGFEDVERWNAPSWSISTEFAAYLLFPLLSMILLRGKIIRITALIFLCPLGLFVVAAFNPNGDLAVIYPYVAGMWRCLISFSWGIGLYRLSIAASSNFKSFFSSDLALAICLSGIFLSMILDIHDVLTVILMAWLVFGAALNHGRFAMLMEAEFVYHLGLISYSIYMTHDFVIRIWGQLEMRLFETSPSQWAAIIFMLAGLGVVLVFSHFTYRYFEAPARKWVSHKARQVYAFVNPG